MTKSFFSSVVQIPSVSRKEDLVVDFIREWAKGRGCKCRQDGFGNVYLTKGSARFCPCLANHVDTVFKDQAEMVDKGVMKELVWKGDVVTANNPLTGRQTGLGGDDLCGCAIALAVLDQIPAGKAVFTVQEELGCLGADRVDASFFDDVSFVVGSDSPEFNRATRYSAGVKLCGDELFDRYVKPICARHGVTKWNSEPMCDCRAYRKIDAGGGKRLDCVNLGNGAYSPHQETEYAVFSDVCSAEKLVLDLCRSVPADRRWTSDYKEDSSKWNPYGAYSQAQHRVWTWRPAPEPSGAKAEFDYRPSGDDVEFEWEFRNGEPAANLYADRIGRLLSPDVMIEKTGRDSVRAVGPEKRLMAAFRFAYNYDNGTSFPDWESFEKAVPQARLEFERALGERKPKRKPAQKAARKPARRDSDKCSVVVPISDPEYAPELMKALADSGLDVDPFDDDGNLNMYGPFGDIKRAVVKIFNAEHGSDYESWDEFAAGEPLDAGAIEANLEFDDDPYAGIGGDAIDVEFGDVSENDEWLAKYRTGEPL